ncbi:SU10 major capsid protein [Natronoarchaeum rubrum]|uniref:SU10 major capsid protein n=1 Tax=Natronoarchaeum rubrum TaxID=755311 RepID=UPI0021125E33|nr:hypothetical protein [Natronoarchaeum rubrum]
MSATDNTPYDDLQTDRDIAARLATPTEDNARTIYDTLLRAFGLPEVPIERGRVGVPISHLQDKLLDSHREHEDDPDAETRAESQFGHRSPFAAAAAAGTGYDDLSDDDRIGAVEDMSERAAIDQTVVGAASPVAVDPQLIDVQRSAAPVLSVITSQAQAGFEAKYNVISDRNEPIGMVSEADAAGDISSLSEGDFTLSTESKDMKIYLDQARISDFSQRAEDTLGYMDLGETTLGQRTIAHALFKAKQIFYGDPSVSAGDNSIEDSNAYEGMAAIYDAAGNSIDKSTTSSGFLEDMLDEVTTQVTNTGLMWDAARYLVSPQFYNAIYDEVTPTIRLDGYDADVEYGPQGLAIGTEQGTVQITPCDNIRSYSGLTGVGANSDVGDVFLIDERAMQFRQLAPFSTVPLGRTGLADKVAMFEYGTLVDKAHGEHGLWLQGYDI